MAISLHLLDSLNDTQATKFEKNVSGELIV